MLEQDLSYPACAARPSSALLTLVARMATWLNVRLMAFGVST